MTNTERPTTKQEQKKQIAVSTPKKAESVPVVKKQEKTEKKKEVKEDKKKIEEKKKTTKPKIKKTEVSVKGVNLQISTKYSRDICKFIKHKKIDNVIYDLEQVLQMRRAIPMKGEIPHRKGKRMMSGRFPKKASENFLMLVKSLKSNAAVNEIENPVIVEAFANTGNRPFGKFGRVRRKRTHVILKAKQVKKNSLKKESNKK
jgi:ribosomal protein L22